MMCQAIAVRPLLCLRPEIPLIYALRRHHEQRETGSGVYTADDQHQQRVAVQLRSSQKQLHGIVIQARRAREVLSVRVPLAEVQQACLRLFLDGTLRCGGI